MGLTPLEHHLRAIRDACMPEALEPLREAFEEAGVLAAWDAIGTLVVKGRDCVIHVQARPAYCDRGRWMVLLPELLPGRTVVDLNLDFADGFPRYYFGAEACASEVLAWMDVRGQR